MHKNFSILIFFLPLNGSANSCLTKYETSSVHLQLQHQYMDFISHKARNNPDQRHSCHSSSGPQRETPLLDYTIKILLFVRALASFFFFWSICINESLRKSLACQHPSQRSISVSKTTKENHIRRRLHTAALKADPPTRAPSFPAKSLSS